MNGIRKRKGFESRAYKIDSGSGFWVNSKDDFLITNGNKLITLFRNKPNEEQALEFASTLMDVTYDR